MRLYPKNPTTQGKDVADAHVQTDCGCVVSACGSVRCETYVCTHWNSFDLTSDIVHIVVDTNGNT